MQTTIPSSITELKYRANQIAGLTISQLATQLQIPIPTTLRHQKGWMGQLLEDALGASAQNLAQPDFPHLGIELKTIPINQRFKPIESTYVCTAPIPPPCTEWEHSWVKEKLSHVLWIPIVCTSSHDIGARQIGTPFFWQPTPTDIHVLKSDWEEITELMCLGHYQLLSGKLGQYLQIRPKAANRNVKQTMLSSDDHFEYIVPKGFYLRSRFTSTILDRFF